MPASEDRYRAALHERLAGEWGDGDLAGSILDGITDAELTRWISRVPLDAVAVDDQLRYRWPAVAGPIDAVMMFAFGHRGPDHDRTPGPVNEAMASALARYLVDHPTRVHTQFEGGEALRRLGVHEVVTVPLERRADGSVVYQSTADFIDAVGNSMTTAEGAVGRVGVVAFADHLGRCILTARAAGLDAVRVEGIDLPAEHDPESTQPWTRDRAAYLAMDLAVRMA